MSIYFKTIPKRNPNNPKAAPNYFASINMKGKRDVRYIAQEIADRSSLNEMDVLSVIEGFLQIIPKTLIDGYGVDLGDFGSMYLTAKSKGVDKEEDFNASHIRGVKVNFRPDRLFKTKLESAKFEKMAAQEKEIKKVRNKRV